MRINKYATPRWVVKKINKGTNGVDLDPCEKIPIADEHMMGVRTHMFQ